MYGIHTLHVLLSLSSIKKNPPNLMRQRVELYVLSISPVTLGNYLRSSPEDHLIFWVNVLLFDFTIYYLIIAQILQA